MKTISIPTHDRPDYLSQVLESIRVQPEAKDYVLVFSCEPNKKVINLIRGIDWAEKAISINHCIRGADMNTFLAVDTAFGVGSDFNVYLEDDYVLSPDALMLANAFYDEISKTDLMLAFRRVGNDPDAPSLVRTTGRCEGLINAGFCCRSWTLPFLRRSWFRFQDNPPGQQGWDWALGRWVAEEQQTVWRPMLNRSRHIGVVGTNSREETFGDINLSGPCASERVESFQFIND